MGRSFGDLQAYFWNLSDIPSGGPVSVGGDTVLLDIVPDTPEWQSGVSQLGNGRARLYDTDRARAFAVAGRVCMIQQIMQGYGASFARLIAMFLIEDVEPFTDGQGIGMIDIRGGGVEKLLSRYPVFKPIGLETLINTTLAAAAAGPTATTMEEGAPVGNDSARLSSLTNVDVGDELRIQMNDTNWHIARVRTIEPSGAPARVIQFDPVLPTNADTGNAVEIRTGRIAVGSVANVVAGQKIVVTLNSGTHTTFVQKSDSAGNFITLVTGLPSAADSGKAVTVYDYSTPTTADVTQAMQFAGPWYATFQTGTGTATGTAHKSLGESVFDVLLSIAERTGEFFRYRILDSNVPILSIDWRRTSDDSGVLLKMYHPTTPWEQVQDETNPAVGTLFSLKKRTSFGLKTRIYPSAGNQDIGLRHCSSTALSYATAHGCYVTLSDDQYIPDSVTYSPGESSYGIQAIRESYGDISLPENANFTEMQAASDQLLLSAVQSLLAAHSRIFYTAEAFIPVRVKPGQTIQIRNTTNTAPYDTGSANYVILDVTEKMRDGRPYTVLTVSDTLGLKRTVANTFGMTMRALTQTVRRVESRGGGGKSIVVSGGGGEPSGGPYVPVVGAVNVALMCP